MSIEQVNVVDAIGVDERTGNVVLTIMDQLDWSSNEEEHLFLLQEKINTYLAFVESGEILESYPEAKGRRVVIDVVGKHMPSAKAIDFIQKVTGLIDSTGMAIKHRVLKQN